MLIFLSNCNSLKINNETIFNKEQFIDLVINDLIGFKARADDVLEIYPLIPKGKWDWFMLDNISYHNKTIALLWDKTGNKYNKGKGFQIYVDGKLLHKMNSLKPVKVAMK